MQPGWNFPTLLFLSLLSLTTLNTLFDLTDALPIASFSSGRLRFRRDIPAYTNGAYPPINTPTNVPSRPSSGALTVSTDSLGGRPTETMSKNGRLLQLEYLGFATPKNVAQWYDYIVEFQAKNPNLGSDISSNPSSAFTNSSFGNLVTAVTLGFVLAILFPFLLCCFCICRKCCNTCGGKLYSKEGYTRTHLLTVFAIFAFVGIMNLTFASVLASYSNDFTATLQIFEAGTRATVKDGAAFASSAMISVAKAPKGITDAIQITIANSTGPSSSFFIAINGTMYVPFFKVMDGLDALVASMRSTLTSVNSSQAAFNKLSADSKALSNSYSTQSSALDAKSMVNVNGTLYSIPAYPSGEVLRNLSLVAGTNTVPDFASLITPLSQNTQIDSFSNQGRKTWGTYVTNMTQFMQGNFGQLLPLDMLSSTGLSTQAASLTSDAAKLDTQLATIFQEIYKYDSYRNGAYAAQVVFVLLPLFLAVIGAFLKSHRMMLFHPCFIIFLMIGFWLEFSLFYLLSTPFNIVCNSKDPILRHDYSTADFQQLNAPGVNSLNLSTSFNPDVFLKSCRDGNTVFSATANSNGDTMLAFGYEFVNSNLGIIDKLIDSVNISSFMTTFDPSSSLNAIDLSALQKANFSAATLSPNSGTAVVTYIVQVNAAVEALTPTSLDADKGSTPRMQAKLDDFNAYAISINVGFTNYTSTYINTNYVTPKVYTYDASLVTGSGVDVRNPTVTAKFMEVLNRLVFIDQANTAISSSRTTVTSLTKTLNSTRVAGDITIANDIAAVTASFGSIQSGIIAIPGLFNTIKTDVASLVTVMRAVGTYMQYYIHILLRNMIASILDAVIVNNPDPDFLNCQQVANDVLFITDGFCQNFINDLTGFWYAPMLLGIFLMFGFVITMMAQKRVDWLKNGASITDQDLFGFGGGKGGKGGAAGTGPNDPTKQVIRTAPVDPFDNSTAPTYEENNVGMPRGGGGDQQQQQQGSGGGGGDEYNEKNNAEMNYAAQQAQSQEYDNYGGGGSGGPPPPPPPPGNPEPYRSNGQEQYQNLNPDGGAGAGGPSDPYAGY